MTDTITPRVGMTFAHARRITGSPKAGTAKPEVYRVSKVTRTSVYYKPLDGGVPTVCDRPRFAEYVKEVIEP
jgi:hypothetical protein